MGKRQTIDYIKMRENFTTLLILIPYLAISQIQLISPPREVPYGSSLMTFEGKAFISLFDPASGSEMWQSDGSESGTSLFTDIAIGTPSSGPFDFNVLSGKLFFIAS